MNNNFCVIMAGGAGSRFWPLSRNSKPKQFLDILGTGRTLLQQTFVRFNKIFPKENIFIVTSDIYKDITLQQLPELNENQVICEPMRRNTAPCIAYANYKIQSINPNANIVVSPSDHLILDESEFIRIINRGLDFVNKEEALLTLGLKPTSPQTGYGYIQVQGDTNGTPHNGNVLKVKTFTEKPDLDMARVFYESGEFYWNSGIFLWPIKAIMKAFGDHLSQVDDLFKRGIGLYNTPEEWSFINKAYDECINISIDYGIMEKADNVHVICSDFGWSDLGTWGSLYENSEKDENGNSVTGNVFTYATNNSIVKVSEDKLAVVEGLRDYIVVEADNVILVCRRSKEQEIKHFVEEIKLQKLDRFI